VRRKENFFSINRKRWRPWEDNEFREEKKEKKTILFEDIGKKRN